MNNSILMLYVELEPPTSLMRNMPKHSMKMKIVFTFLFALIDC